VPNAEVIVFVSVDAMPQQGANPQRADGDQHHADELLRAVGKPLDGSSALEQPNEQADQRDATGMAKAPVEAKPPCGVRLAACGEGRQRGQVVRPADHVGESCRKTDE